ncbi:MAG: type IV toxin-antitoxin system AbiEi family antitoxin domain-containing protein [Actinobacteria bacterium]|nr:type IV toxin-antitoxin system AbiEi family antitoxin domain-containing protein [Actinomycetota bacterium]
MGTQKDTDRVIAALAARQWGVVSRGQLLDAGLSRKQIADRVRAGRLLTLHPGVYAVGHARLRSEGHWLAAVLAAGPGAVLSHRDAAGLHGLRPANHARIDVATTGRARSSAKLQLHRTRVLDADDVTTVSGIPVTTVARTLVDLAGQVPRDHLAKAIKEAERQRTFDLNQVQAAMARTRGRTGRGHRALSAAIEEHATLGLSATDSILEDAVHRLVHDNGLPSPEINAYVEGFKIDATWPAQRIAVELDGWAHHHTRDAFERDRERDATLTAAGWRVVRFTHRQVIHRPDAVVETLRRLGLAP